AEAAGFLVRSGCSQSLADRAAGFYRCWDEARFAPRADRGPDQLVAAAAKLILDLEAETARSAERGECSALRAPLSALHVVCLVALSGPGADLPTDDCLRQADATLLEGVRLPAHPEHGPAAVRA